MTARDIIRPILVLLSFAGGLAMAAPTRQVPEPVVDSFQIGPRTVVLDFGRVAFGNLKITAPPGTSGKIRVHFGEASKAGRVDRTPPGSVRYAAADASLRGGGLVIVAPPPDPRNTKQPEAVPIPREFGVILPFRWVEIEGWPGTFDPAAVVRQSVFLADWVDDAAAFHCSDEMLNRVWDLCRYSIKATTFAGVYVDGDRERIPYEADAYLNQLSHYGTDTDVRMARDTFDWLMRRPTWPTEWAPHMVLMAHADWMHTGDVDWLRPRYESLKGKLLMNRVRPDGFVGSDGQQRSWNDIVDWPDGERDGYQRTEVNTVVNAFHIAAIMKMADLAEAVGNEADARSYANEAAKKLDAFNRELFIDAKGAYRDGMGTAHTALHASLFPLAFGLVPEAKVGEVADFVAKRGMRCSVYAAQYLLEGMFRAGKDKEALELMLADGDRSWRHMVESGTTITWEAWDQKYKPNQDWNHAWGAAPANLLPRFVLGAEPLEPGWSKVRIQPRPGDLTEAEGKVPTPKGPILVRWKKEGKTFGLMLDLPDGVEATVILPEQGGRKVFVEGDEVASHGSEGWLSLDEPLTGNRKVVVR